MGKLRKYLLNVDYTTVSGNTNISGTMIYDLRDAFSGTSIFNTSGTTFTYNEITLDDISDMSSDDYNNRVVDFLSYVHSEPKIYTYTMDGLDELISDSEVDDI